MLRFNRRIIYSEGQLLDERKLSAEAALSRGATKRFRATRVMCLFCLLATFPSGSADGETIMLSGAYSYNDYEVHDLEPGSIIDARNADFKVANSRNTSPNETADCEEGSLPVNRNPLRVYESSSATLIGGRFNGEVPQTSDWVHTYCNSVAVVFRDSPRAGIEGVRARWVWDGIRFSQASPHFRVERVWLSGVRDDCVENDFLLGGVIKDSLFDGCFVGLSMRPPRGEVRLSASGTVTLEGVLMRLQPYLYEGETTHGYPFKLDEGGPNMAIYNSVIAMSHLDTIKPSKLNASWSRIADCSNNLLLWTSEQPWPDQLDVPPHCFRVLLGDEAQAVWQTVRRNWINCHSLAVRFADDAQSDPSDCDRSVYGGHY